MKLALVSLSAVSLISFAIAQPISIDQLQAEIASLRQIVAEKSAELEKLRQQLKRL